MGPPRLEFRSWRQMQPPMVSPGETASQLQYCSIKAGAMVSKPIADYAVGPDLHAAVFLVRADKKTRIFFRFGGGSPVL